ncbi:MAG: hypothetical protein AABY22_14595 [Nanoarchaeota archaeon]
MARNRIIYNVQDVLVGPSESVPNRLVKDNILLQRLERVFAFDYNINVPRINVQSLGTQSSVVNQNINGAQIDFSINYYINGVGNEARVGMTPLFNPENSGLVYFRTGITQSNPFSGFFNTVRDGDKRNFYLVIGSGEDDVHRNESLRAFDPSGSFEDFYSAYSLDRSVITFVNSYLTSYNVNASVGNFPIVKLGYVADEIIGFASGSGVYIPEVSHTSKLATQSKDKFIIPRYSGDFNSNIPSVILPGDIIINLSNSNFKDILININDAKIESLDISIDLARENISFLGDFRPRKREILYPINAKINFTMGIGDLQTGSILDLINDKDEYDFSINLYNQKASVNILKHVLTYDIKKARLENLSFSDSIGDNLTANFNFITEITPTGFQTGLFLSGIISHKSDGTLSNFHTALLAEAEIIGPLLLENSQEIFIERLAMTPLIY